MQRRICISVALAIMLLFPAISMAATRYIYTSSGKMTPVHTMASSKSPVSESLKNGTRVSTHKSYSGGWVNITYTKGGSKRNGYVKSSHLVSSIPGTSTGSSDDPSADMNALNAQYRSMRTITPYTVVVTPAKASCFVNLRWGPDTSTEVIDRLYQGTQLTVVAQSASWAQVQDPVTGKTGYIMRSFLTDYFPEEDGDG